MIFPQVEGERQKANKNHHLPLGTHVSFIFRGYNPEFWGVKPSFFMVLGSKASYLMEKVQSLKWMHPAYPLQQNSTPMHS